MVSLGVSPVVQLDAVGDGVMGLNGDAEVVGLLSPCGLRTSPG